MANLPAIQSEGNSASGELIQLVSFKVDNEEYDIEVLKAHEIIRMIPLTHMPNIPSYVERKPSRQNHSGRIHVQEIRPDGPGKLHPNSDRCYGYQR